MTDQTAHDARVPYTHDGIFVNGPNFCFEQATTRGAELVAAHLNTLARQARAYEAALQSIARAPAFDANTMSIVAFARSTLTAARAAQTP